MVLRHLIWHAEVKQFWSYSFYINVLCHRNTCTTHPFMMKEEEKCKYSCKIHTQSAALCPTPVNIKRYRYLHLRTSRYPLSVSYVTVTGTTAGQRCTFAYQIYRMLYNDAMLIHVTPGGVSCALYLTSSLN
jgi:hypothetical protein